MLQDIFAHTPALPFAASCGRARYTLAIGGRTRDDSVGSESSISLSAEQNTKSSNLGLLECSSVLATPRESFGTAMFVGKS